jgi:predicted nucleic acid-binding protein
MIACDTSVLIEYLNGSSMPEAMRLDHELASKNVALPPVVLTEVLSDPGAGPELIESLGSIPMLEPSTGYWHRAGRLRAQLRKLRLRAPLADTLICQSCLDYGVALLTRDADFRRFAKHCGLKLV